MPENILRNNILENIDTISGNLDKNKFIENARKSFKENIKTFEIPDDERARLIAQYEAQISIATISEIIKLAKEIPLDEANLKNLAADTAIKDEQQKIALEQISSEKAKTKLILEQIRTELYRQKDLRASTCIKIASNEVTKQQAKFEEARRWIAITSNNQNTFMKKADYWNGFMQSLATDDKVVINAEQMTSVKTAIEAIPTQKIEYESEVMIKEIKIEDKELDPVTLDTEVENG